MTLSVEEFLPLEEFAWVRGPIAQQQVAAITAKYEESERKLAAERLARAEDAAIIERLKLQIAKLKHDKYGAKSERSERLDGAAEPTCECINAAADDIYRSTEITRTERRRPARRGFPSRYERERVVVPAPSICPCCGGTRLSKLGEDITETLEVIPRKFKVVQTVREKFSCRDCETIIQPPAPFHAIPRAFAGPNFLASMLFNKYGQHQPLNRQSVRYEREGVPISVSTLVGLVSAAAEALKPIHERLAAHVLTGRCIHGDDTTVPVLAKGKTIVGRLWAYLRDERPFSGHAPPAVIFAYSPDRRAEHVREHLAKWHGILHSDAYAGYGAMSKTMPKGAIRHAFCWAHARRQFFKLAAVKDPRNGRRQSSSALPSSPVAREAVRRIDELFAIERAIKGLGAGARLAIRQEKSTPRVQALEIWMRQQRAALSRHSDSAKAMDYLLTRWEGFTAFLYDGEIGFDNNPAEGALRAVAVGRRNWTFCGSDRGGRNAALMYSLIGSCKLNNVDPQAWLADVLDRIAQHPTRKLDELLPWNWQPKASERIAT